MHRKQLLIVVAVLVAPVLAAAAARIEAGEHRDLEIFYSAQFWAIATTDAVASGDLAVDDRLDFMLRRGRVGVRGRFSENVDYLFQFAFDKLGKEAFDAVPATPQATNNLEFYLFDFFVTYRVQPDWLHVSAGYFRPQVSYESMVSPFKVPSLDKSLINALLREHMVGRSQGRETGVNVGGQVVGARAHLAYNLGLFDTNHEKILGDPAGGRWAPLWTGRLAVGLGAPPQDAYSLRHTTQYFGKRRGVTLAVNGTHQGGTNETLGGTAGSTKYSGGFRQNRVLGGDLLANYDGWNLSAEYLTLHREFSDGLVAACDALEAAEYDDVVYHVRASYEIPLTGGRFLEPTVMYSRFEGDADSARYPDGVHEQVSVGVNWYLEKHRHKLSLHYVAQDGEPVSRYAKANDRLGDYLGVGLQLSF
jgi:hypothetical protein